ncbi:MAG: hypothetical protein M5R36_12470 [Deltaproteobacteria bacterium]|nr:hypothetical protein [Deltaproteobacteria bacterium]
MNRYLALFTIFALVLTAGQAFAADDDETDWTDIVSVGGYIDGRVVFRGFTPDTGESDDEETFSDIKVFEAAVAPHAQLNEHVSVDAVLYYIEGADHPIGHYAPWAGRSESLTIDEFYLTYACHGFWAKLGKYYPPIGNFTTYGIGYTRVQDLFWTRVSALGLGYDYSYTSTGKSPFGLSVHTFNGDFENVAEKDGAADPNDNTIDGFAANLYIAPLAFMKDDDMSVELGGYYLSDATETLAALSGILMPQDILGTAAPADDVILYENDVPLYGGYLTGEFAFTDMFGLGVAAEYATTGEFDDKEYVDAAGEATAISATHAELALLFDNKNIQVGGKYGAVSGLDWLDTARFNGMYPTKNLAWEPTDYSEFGGFVGTDYIDGLHLAFQFLSGSDNENNATTLGELQAKVVF